MNIEEAVNFLVEHAAQVDAKLGAMSSEMGTLATKRDLLDLKEELRNGTRAMRHYVKYVEGLLDRVTKGQLLGRPLEPEAHISVMAYRPQKAPAGKDRRQRSWGMSRRPNSTP